MGVDQVPVVVNVHRIPAVVVFGPLELVARAVVQTLGKSCQHCTEQAGIPTARVISLYSTENITMIQGYKEEHIFLLNLKTAQFSIEKKSVHILQR